MQSNVTILTTAAKNQGGFRLYTDDAPHEFRSSDFPHLVVYDRVLTEIEPVTVDLGKYNATWRYTLSIVNCIDGNRARGTDYTTHEALVMNYLKQLYTDSTFPYFELVEPINPREGVVGENMVIVSEITLERVTHYEIDS